MQRSVPGPLNQSCYSGTWDSVVKSLLVLFFCSRSISGLQTGIPKSLDQVIPEVHFSSNILWVLSECLHCSSLPGKCNFWLGVERPREGESRDTLGRAGRDRCVGQGLKGLRKRFWEGWGQWQPTCHWVPGVLGVFEAKATIPAPLGSAATEQEKGRLFGEGVQEEGAWSTISGGRGQVYTGGQWGGQLEL